jgi:SAM-dependent methyltransferase
MLKVAAAKQVQPKPVWQQMDPTDLRFPDKSFDIVTISLALHHMPRAMQRDVLAEVARVCRRRIVIVEPRVPKNPRLWSLWLLFAYFVDDSEYLSEWVKQDLAVTCRASGLRVVSTKRSNFGMHCIMLCTPVDGV